MNFEFSLVYFAVSLAVGVFVLIYQLRGLRRHKQRGSFATGKMLVLEYIFIVGFAFVTGVIAFLIFLLLRELP